MSDPLPLLRDLSLKAAYDSGDNLLASFYVPVLSRATRYDRSVGFFRSSSLAAAARGVARFVHHGGTMRLLCGAELTEEDRDALVGAKEVPESLAKRLVDELITDDELARRRLEVLAFLAQEGRLEVRIALANAGDGCFHEKIGVLWDSSGDGVAFQGSANESAAAWQHNFEAFSVFCSWDAGAGHFSAWATKFDTHWAGAVPGYKVVALPEAVRQALVSLAPPEVPPAREPEESAPAESDPLVARYLVVAPRLVDAEALAEATSGVAAFPHQHQVVARLADGYPRSWLVADEVGLGKTISAGLALRRLVLSGQVAHAVILAPANVCRQWQDELFEKFGLWVPRLERGQLLGAHPDDVETLGAEENPFERPLLIASSHLARRPEQRRRLLQAGPWDLVILDEAHHARRRDFSDLTRYRPTRLLDLLDELSQTRAARALWLLTATPMQVHPVELCDLLRHVGLRGALDDQGYFLRFFAELAKPDEQIDWTWLAHVLTATPRLPTGPAEHALLAGIEARIGPLGRARVERFAAKGSDPAELAAQLGEAGRIELRSWLRQLGPTGQHLTRHTRATLRRYHEEGRLQDRLPDRKVSAVAVTFTAEETTLYGDLDDLIDRLAQAQGIRRSGFLQTVYRRRLTSSWAAIGQSLRRRLHGAVIEPEEDQLDEEDDLDEESTDDRPALTEDDRARIGEFLDRATSMHDSKFDRLRADLDEARSSGRAVIVFTQFADTLASLRDRLVGVYSAQLATFTGEGGRQFRTDEGWVSVSKVELVEALQARRVSVVLATDAASEGLNLQAASFLVNYDMPWNPMRVEQRIGRIDRLGQLREVVEVRNYFVAGTVEERVYAALGERIDLFSGMVGTLQPILGATEQAFRAIFRTPRSERAALEHRQTAELLTQLDQFRRTGIDLPDEDLMPEPAYPPPPVDFASLRRLVDERFGVVVDRPGRPATWDPAQASRDPESWTALATYGHPILDDHLDRLARRPVPVGAALVLNADAGGPVRAAVRADRSPPTAIRSVDEVDDLGPAVASGDAESLAFELARTEEERRQAQAAAVEEFVEGGFESEVRRRFTDLAQRVIAAECAAAAARGERKEPGIAWLELRRDTYSGWAYATAFAQQLGIDVTKIAAPSLIDACGGPAFNESQLKSLRRSTGQELQSLIKNWKVRRGTDAASPAVASGGSQ